MLSSSLFGAPAAGTGGGGLGLSSEMRCAVEEAAAAIAAFSRSAASNWNDNRYEKMTMTEREDVHHDITLDNAASTSAGVNECAAACGYDSVNTN